MPAGAPKQPGLVCPLCGQGEMNVVETRSGKNYVRRRRICSSSKCDGKLPTIEIEHPKLEVLANEVVAVPRSKLEELAALLKTALDGKEPSNG